MSLREDIVKVSKHRGFNPIVGDIFLKQEQWFSYWRGDVNGLHTFQQKINGRSKTFKRNTMNMPKKLTEDYHSLIWNENCKIKLESENANKIVQKVLHDNNFEVEFGSLLEIAFGMGNGYMIEYLDEDITKIDFIYFKNAIPLAYDNGVVKALVTHYTEKISKDKYRTLLAYHSLVKGKYTVDYEVYISKDESVLGDKRNSELANIFKGAKDKFTITYDTDQLFFQHIKPNLKNHHDITLPHGVSVYGTMLDYFRIADIMFDMLETEVITNRTRIAIGDEATKTKFQTDDAGNTKYINYFDEDDISLMAMDLGDEFIKHLQGDLRMDQLKIAIDKILQLIGFRAGLGKNFYSFNEGDGGNYQNEKSVMTSNSDTYRTKKKHEIVLREAILNLVKSILHLEKITGRYTGDIDKENIEIIFDDSIAIDDEAIEQKYKTLADSGYIPKWRVVEKMLNVSEDEARMIVAEAEASEQARNKAYLDDYAIDDVEEQDE